MSENKSRYKNLKVPTSEEARKNGKKGGDKSAQTRRRKKLMSEVANDLLNGKPVEELAQKMALAFGMPKEEIDNQTIILLAQLKKAFEGDSKAFELIRDTAGQNPVQRTEMSGTVTQINVSRKVINANTVKRKQ